MDDYEAIRQLLAAYAHAMDDARADDVAALFEPDGEFVVLGSTMRGRDAITALVRRYAAAGALTNGKHMVTNMEIQVDSDRATARSDWMVVRATRSGWRVVAVGEYRDVLVRRERWRFVRREDLLVGPAPRDAAAIAAGEQ